MKKLILRIGIGIVVVVVIALAVVWFKLNSIVKAGVETVGPHLTKTEVKLDSVSLSPFSGRGELKGLFVGNPEGYKTPSAIKMGALAVAVDVSSITSDKIIVKSILIDSPEITLEGGLKDNNLTKILANLEAASGGGAKTAPSDEKSQKAEKSAQRKIQVDDFTLLNARVNLNMSMLGGTTVPVVIPKIHLTGLGSGDGITVAELSKRIFNEILGGTTSAATDAVGMVGKTVTDAAKSLGSGAKDGAQKATKGITDLFKK